MRLSQWFSPWSRLGLVLVWGFWACTVAAQTTPLAVPALSARVIDQTQTLNAVQRQALDDKLAAFEASHGSQVVVLMIATTAPEDIASYANRVGSAWKIGRKEVGDGLLLLVAKDDRKLRIEVSQTLEGAIPDLAAKQVIEQTITPRFKQGDFAGGLDAGVDHIAALIKREALPPPTQPVASSAKPDGWITIAVINLVMLVVFGVGRGWAGVRTVLVCASVGAVVGAAVWLTTADDNAMVEWALFSSFFAFIFVAEFMKPKAERFQRSSTAIGRNNASGSGWGGFSSGGFSSGGGNSGGGFSSGGGGGFGGGGASGGW